MKYHNNKPLSVDTLDRFTIDDLVRIAKNRASKKKSFKKHLIEYLTEIGV